MAGNRSQTRKTAKNNALQAGATNAESQRQQRASALLDSLDAIQLATPIGRFDRSQAQRHSSPA